MLKEFKEFASKGSFVDLAVGVVVGGAVATVVKSLVEDVIMPPIGYWLGGVDFASLYINMGDETYESFAAAKEAGAAVIGYGAFINAVITFVIVLFVLFMLVKGINRMRAPEADAPMKDCPFCMTSIPDEATRCPACTSELGAG
jgi:large conductance mechanosensitive channel